MWAISRITRGSACVTPNSVVHSSGTSWKPSLRAASAGNSAVRSGVAVKMTLITSSVVMALRVITSVTSSAVPARIWSRASASTWIAPRTASTATEPPRGRGASELDGRVQLAELLGGERPDRTRLEPAELERPELGAGELLHRETDLGEQPAHDVLAALVQGHLDEDPPADLVEHAEIVGLGEPVRELDALLEPLAEVAADRPVDLGEVGLGDAVAGVHEAVRELTVVGEDQQSLGVGVATAGVEAPFRDVADVGHERLAPARVGHGADHAGGLVEHVVAQFGTRGDAFAVDVDDGLLGVDTSAEPRHLLAVDGHPPGRDQVLAGAPAGPARLGEHLLQPDALIGLVHRCSSSMPSRSSGRYGASSGSSSTLFRPSRSRK